MISHCQKCGASHGSHTVGGFCSACLLATALDDDATDSAAMIEMPTVGKRFGDYQLLEELGRGGMGVVYRAKQLSLNRPVALKVLLASPYADSEARYRFSKEAETAAALQHPGIVAIHEIGEHEGVPYLTMGLIEGSNLSQLCGGKPLSAVRAAKFVSAIADAVQHAHEHRVFHRDLKPSNILVDANDRPHVTDFGIAKRLDDVFDATITGQILGSPNYLSPEQAAGNTNIIGPPTDVYGLGAVLYYLLTGRAPFLGATMTETFRLVIETDPVPPRLLNPDIPRDLETVCLKCLEKDYSRRYETAESLALDLRRFLQNEPVSAQPPSNSYRLIKFVRRNRLAVSAALAVALALVAGTVVSTYQAVRAKRAEHVAEVERTTAVNERARAEDLLTFMLGDLREQLARVGRLDVLEAVGNKAMAYFASRDVRDLDDRTLANQAKALTQIGEIRMEQTRYAEATAAFSEAYSRASALAARHPKDGEILFARGQAEYWNGFVHWKCGELTATSHWLNLYHKTGEALVALDSSRSAWQRELANGQHNLAVLKQERGEFAAARHDFLAELVTTKKLRDSDPSDFEARFLVANVHAFLGVLEEQQGNFAEALKHYEAQTLEFERLVRDAPQTARWQYKLANSLLYETDLYLVTGKSQAASGRLKEAQKFITVLVGKDPANVHWWAASLNSRLKEATLALHENNFGAVAKLVEVLKPQLEELSNKEPNDRKFMHWVATLCRMEAQLALATGEGDAASSIRRAIEIGEKLFQQGRALDPDIGECATAYMVSGEIFKRDGDFEAALRQLNRAYELLTPRLTGTRDRRLLDPAARVTILLHRYEEANRLLAQLTSIGYQPLYPWPSRDQVVVNADLIPVPSK